MARQFTIRQELPVSVDGFWKHIFANEDFNRALYIDHLGFRYELEEWDPATGHRRARIWPTTDVPRPVAAVMGDKISFVEDGTYDAAAGRYDFHVVPSTLPDRLHTTGSVVATAVGENRCERLVTIEIEARVFGVGGVIEAFLEGNTREQYDKNAAFAKEYLAKLGH